MFDGLGVFRLTFMAAGVALEVIGKIPFAPISRVGTRIANAVH